MLSTRSLILDMVARWAETTAKGKKNKCGERRNRSLVCECVNLLTKLSYHDTGSLSISPSHNHEMTKPRRGKKSVSGSPYDYLLRCAMRWTFFFDPRGSLYVKCQEGMNERAFRVRS